MNQIKFWHLAGWSNYNCPTCRQSYLCGRVLFLVGKQNKYQTCGVGWEISWFLFTNSPVVSSSCPLYTYHIYC